MNTQSKISLATHKKSNEMEVKPLELSHYEAIRKETGFISANLVSSLIQVSGPGSTEFLDRVLPGKIGLLQPLSALMTPVLDEDIRLIDFIYVLNMEDHFTLLVTPSAKDKVMHFFQSHASSNVTIADMTSGWEAFMIEGPYSWKVAKEVVGPEVIGLRFLYAMEFDLNGEKAICLRSGITGEYGYRFLCKRPSIGLLLEAIDPLKKFTAKPVPLGELEILCNETRMPVFGVTLREGDCPFEMGIRYTLDFQKEGYVYREKLLAGRDEVSRGLVGFQIRGSLNVDPKICAGKPVYFMGEPIGVMRYVGFSPVLNAHFGFAFLNKDFAYPGLINLVGWADLQGAFTLTTLSSPLITPLSLGVVAE